MAIVLAFYFYYLLFSFILKISEFLPFYFQDAFFILFQIILNFIFPFDVFLLIAFFYCFNRNVGLIQEAIHNQFLMLHA